MITKEGDLNRFVLRFQDRDRERAYVDFVLAKTEKFARIVWGSVIFFGATFALMDRSFFGEDAGAVLWSRAVLFSLASCVIAVTYVPRLRTILRYSSALFVLLVGTFCIVTVGFSDPSTFTPYFSGLFLSYAGIFSTPGLGFRHSVLALLANLAMFEIMVLFLVPVSPQVLIMYQFFLLGTILVFILAGYLVERTFRENYLVSEELRQSLSQVKQLSGMLPICSSCKKVRDDEGYWRQIEAYIGSRSEAQFSHGICPDCEAELYPDLAAS